MWGAASRMKRHPFRMGEGSRVLGAAPSAVGRACLARVLGGVR